jgi:hypothetical protein
MMMMMKMMMIIIIVLVIMMMMMMMMIVFINDEYGLIIDNHVDSNDNYNKFLTIIIILNVMMIWR